MNERDAKRGVKPLSWWPVYVGLLLLVVLVFFAGALWAPPSGCVQRLVRCEIQYHACQDQDD